jgi:hypothetical protein
MLHALGQLEGPFTPITYFGDGLWDRAAAALLGWEFVAVGPKLGWTLGFRRRAAQLRVRAVAGGIECPVQASACAPLNAVVEKPDSCRSWPPATGRPQSLGIQTTMIPFWESRRDGSRPRRQGESLARGLQSRQRSGALDFDPPPCSTEGTTQAKELATEIARGELGPRLTRRGRASAG